MDGHFTPQLRTASQEEGWEKGRSVLSTPLASECRLLEITGRLLQITMRLLGDYLLFEPSSGETDQGHVLCHAVHSLTHPQTSISIDPEVKVEVTIADA